MWEYIGSWNDPNYMAHSGVKGQKWGVRRYQNEDGSLTPEGRRHYALLYGGAALGTAAAAGLGHYLGGTTQGKLIRGAIGRGNLKGAGRLVGQSLTRTGKAVKRFVQNKVNPINNEAIRADAKRMKDSRLASTKRLKGIGNSYNAVADAPLSRKSINDVSANARRMADLAGHNGGAMHPFTVEKKKALMQPIYAANAANASNARRMADLAGHNGGAMHPFTIGKKNVLNAPIYAANAANARRMADLAAHNGGSMMGIKRVTKIAKPMTTAQSTAASVRRSAKTYGDLGKKLIKSTYNNNRGLIYGAGAGLASIGAGAATAGIARTVDGKKANKSKKRR